MVWIITRLIFVYKGISRVFVFKSCRFHPSCSDYALDALHKHGLFKGSWLAFWRIIRCSPLSKGGYDPVR